MRLKSAAEPISAIASGMRYQRAELPLKLDGLAAARDFFAGCLADGDPARESLWVAHVDEQARCIHLSRHEGDEKRRRASRCARSSPTRPSIGSAGIVLAHNHPSGDPRPSESDCRATRRLATPPRRSTAPCSIIWCSRGDAVHAASRQLGLSLAAG